MRGTVERWIVYRLKPDGTTGQPYSGAEILATKDAVRRSLRRKGTEAFPTRTLLDTDDVLVIEQEGSVHIGQRVVLTSPDVTFVPREIRPGVPYLFGEHAEV